MISSSLERFRWVLPSRQASFRCNVCGDSLKSKLKTRGNFYLIRKDDKFNFKCYNCGESMSFKRYLKTYFPHYWNDFRLDLYKDSATVHRVISDELSSISNKSTVVSEQVPLVNTDDLLVSLNELPADHIAIKYCTSRKIPPATFSKLYYAEDYSKWVKSFPGIPENHRYPNDPRLVMLMKDRTGKIFGAQGRALKESTIRYSTVKFDPDTPKLFGLESIRDEYPMFVLEGIIDSLFVPNSLAICGGDVGTSMGDVDVTKCIFVFDNEPRNSDTVKRMLQVADMGAAVVVWPIDSKLKDVNQMILDGMSKADILRCIMSNNYKGKIATMKIKQWKKT